MPDFNAPKTIPLWAHIALGVFLGTLAAAFLAWQFSAWKTRQAAEEAAVAIQQSQDLARAKSAANAKATAEIEQAARQAEQAIRAQEAERRKLEAEAKQAAELAWAKYYKKPAACDETKGGSWTVDCANDYMRAKKRFSTEYGYSY